MYDNKGLFKKTLSIALSLVIGILPISSNMPIAEANSDKTPEEIENIYSQKWEYGFTGETEEFIAPMEGAYRVKLWGAKGGSPSDGIIEGGRGAYVEGTVTLLKGEKLKINVGESPGMRYQGGWNGGGDGYVDPTNLNKFGGGGGGATDVRKENVKQAVAAGGAGGGIVHFTSSVHNAQRSQASEGGSGGTDVGQSSGFVSETRGGKSSSYTIRDNYISGGGNQSQGGVASYNDYGGVVKVPSLNGSFGQGGKGEPGHLDSSIVSSFGGGGGAGWYGGAGGFYRGNQQSPSGGGGSSYIDKFEKDRHSNWIRGWDTQISYRDPTQNRNHSIEKHGYAIITKDNEAPFIRLKEGFTNGETYASQEAYKNRVAIRDRDTLGGNVEIFSTVKIGNSLQPIKSHGKHPITMDERDVEIDIFIPEHKNANTVSGEVKIWAVDEQGLKAEEITRTFTIRIPDYTRIEVIPGVKGWSNGSYNAKIVITDPVGIHSASIMDNANKAIGQFKGDKHRQEVDIAVTENGSFNLNLVSSSANGYTQKRTIHFNNISTLQEIKRTRESVAYKIKNYGIIEEQTQWQVTTSKQVEEHIGNITRKTEGLGPNEKVKISYKLFDLNSKELNNGWTPYQEIHSLSVNAEKGKLISYTKDTAELTFEPNETNIEEPKYQFRAIQTSGSGVLDLKRSVKLNAGDLVKINGLLPNTEYRIETTTYNSDGVEGDWTHLKDDTGKTIVFKTKGDLNFKFDLIEEWINEYRLGHRDTRVANLTGKVEFNVNQKMAMYINIGSNNRFKVSDNITNGAAGTVPYNIEIRKTMFGSSRIYKDTSKSNAVNQYIIELASPDDKYKVWLETEVDGEKEEHDAGWIGIDTKGPQSKVQPIYKKIMANKGVLTLNTKEITDISTPVHEITIDYGQGRMPLFSEKMITFTENMDIKLYDKLGNFSILKTYIDLSGYVEGSDKNPEIEDDPDKIPIAPDDNVVEVPVPNGGTHMQTSLDGVTWSVWEPRANITYVTLSTGDGYKTVYVRTGQEMLKDTPVFNTELGSVEMVQQKGGEIIPLSNTRTYKYISDLTAPNLEIRTLDNMMIAIDGEITFLLDVVDNLDKKPKVKIEILAKDEIRYSKEVKLSKGMTTGAITPKPTDLPEFRDSSNKLQAYTLRVTATDKNNNITVKHVNFYVKNKARKN